MNAIDHAEEVAMVRETARRFAMKEVEPHYEQWERDEIFPRELWRALGREGLLCPDMPESYGGAGASFRSAVAIVEEFARAGHAAVAVGLTVHANICAHYVLRHGTEVQKQRYLPAMVSGECVAAIAMSEPAAGSDLQGIRATARRSDDGWVLDGQKTFITNGQHANMIIVAAKTDTSVRGADGTSLFLVDADRPGFSRGRNLEKIGLHASDTSELFLEGVEVTENALLGELNRGFRLLMTELPRERLTLGAQAVGATQGMLDWTLDYVRERQAFGQPLANFQNTRFELADMQTRTEGAAAFLEQCAQRIERGELDATTAAKLKLLTTEVQCEVADRCLQLFGGYGYMREYPISRAFVDARIQRIYGGTSEIMKEIIAKEMLK